MWRKNPFIYEINAWTWMHFLSDKYGYLMTLGQVPDNELDTLLGWGLDGIWLMGVWERSPLGRKIALEHPDLQAEYHNCLPDFTPEDVVGSPFCIHRYEVDSHLGGREGLATIRARLAERGLKLVLDFVPNHVAPDHPWIESCPDCFVQGTADDYAMQPSYYFQAGNRYFAMGRDPYFPAWTDTAQLNAFSPTLRQKASETLLDIASQCDAVRCDMAMLMTTQVFSQTWGARAGNPLAEDYWRVIIPVVKSQYPDFLLIGEVYWEMEWEMQQQGFDYVYDKRLYDRLHHEPPRAIRSHLQADLAYQERLVRLIENHDEECAAETLGQERGRPAGILVTTLPGAALLHEGQFVGHKIKLAVQLGRRPHEEDYSDIEAFYCMLMSEATLPIYHEGEWSLREVFPAWDLNATSQNLIAYTWRLGDERRLIVINYSSTPSQGRVGLPDFGLEDRQWRLLDVLHDVSYEREGDDMAEHGLYIDLHPWESHIFTLSCC
jgi:hypothetical protein